MGESSTSIEDLCAHLDLGPQDSVGLDLNEFLDEEEPSQGPKWCIVGRLLTKRNINFKAIQDIMLSVWSPVMKVWMKELESNLFLIQFEHEMDYDKVINGGPWTFDQHLFVFEPLQQDSNPHSVVLNYADFWVQVYDLCTGYISEQVVKAIGNYIGQFVYSDPKNFDGLWKSFLRVRVRMDISKSLKKNMKIKKRNQEETWVNFKYERLPNFCFFCGIIGHAERSCVKLYQYPDKNAPRLFGTFLRAPVGRSQVKPNSQWKISQSYGGWSEASSRSVSDLGGGGNDGGRGTGVNSGKGSDFKKDSDINAGVKSGSYPKNHANSNESSVGYFSHNNPLYHGDNNPIGGVSDIRATMGGGDEARGSNLGVVLHNQPTSGKGNLMEMGLDDGPGTVIIVDNKKRRFNSGPVTELGQEGNDASGSNILLRQSSKNSVEAGLGVGARRAL